MDGSFKRLKIQQINDHIWLLNDHDDGTGYLITGTDRALVIDTMYGQEDLKEAVRTLTDLPPVLVNTHGHFDHTYGNLYFDTRPLIDCFRWSKDGKIGGGYFKKDGRAVTAVKDFTVHKINDSTVYADIETEDGVIRLTFREKSIVFDFPSDGYTFKTVIYTGKNPVIGFEKGRILCRYCDFDFAAVLSDAVCEIHEDGYVIIPDNKSFEIKF